METKQMSYAEYILEETYMSINSLLGKKIKKLREDLGLTQQEMAEKIGVESPSYISKIERGLTSPSYELLARAAEELGVQLKDLFDFEGSIRRKTEEKLEHIDKWLLRFRSLLKNQQESEIQAAYYVVKKICRKEK